VPVIVLGADTELGRSVVAALLPRAGEVRAFVTDPESADSLRAQGVKVAVGDVSDGSHVGGAALGAFSAVLLAVSAEDDRERSFADTPAAVAAAWADGLGDAGVRRVIWVGDGDLPPPLHHPSWESAVVPTNERNAGEVAADVAALDAAETIADPG
jgi:NAD(P)H dehydrogenase (quinone)